MALKTFLVGLNLQIYPGEPEQLAFALVISLAFLGLQAQMRPYKNLIDDTMALACDFVIVVMLAW